MSMSLGEEQKKIALLAIVGLLFSLSVSVVLNRNPVAVAISDFYLRWYSVDRLFTEGRSLYDARNSQEAVLAVWGESGLPRDREQNFYYPAHAILLIGPLALLPYPTAHLIWTLVGQVLFLASLWLIMRLVHWPNSINGQTVFIVLSVVSIPYLQHTIWGQFKGNRRYLLPCTLPTCTAEATLQTGGHMGSRPDLQAACNGIASRIPPTLGDFPAGEMVVLYWPCILWSCGLGPRQSVGTRVGSYIPGNIGPIRFDELGSRSHMESPPDYYRCASSGNLLAIGAQRPGFGVKPCLCRLPSAQHRLVVSGRSHWGHISYSGAASGYRPPVRSSL